MAEQETRKLETFPLNLSSFFYQFLVLRTRQIDTSTGNNIEWHRSYHCPTRDKVGRVGYRNDGYVFSVYLTTQP